MLKGFANSKKQGDAGLGTAIAYFCREGYNVCIPLTDSQAYDLIVEKDNIISRVQIKTTWSVSEYGIFKAALKTCGGNRSGNTSKLFDPSVIEFLFILTNDGTTYLIPTFEGMPVSSINLGQQYDQFKV